MAEIADGKASVYDVGDSGSIPGSGRFLGNAKKQRKTTEWERIEITSRKLKITREYFMQRWAS